MNNRARRIQTLVIIAGSVVVGVAGVAASGGRVSGRAADEPTTSTGAAATSTTAIATTTTLYPPDFITVVMATSGRAFSVSAGYCLRNGSLFGEGRVSASLSPDYATSFSVDGLLLDADGTFHAEIVAPPGAPGGRYAISPMCVDGDSVLVFPVPVSSEITLGPAPATTTTAPAELPATR